MQVDQLLDDGQTQAQTAVAFGAAGVLLTKSLENARQKVLADALAMILDHQLKILVCTRCADFNSCAFGREFDGIAQ